MDICENENILKFDTLYTNNHIQILKILLPFCETGRQRRLAVMIKYMELKYTMDYFDSHNTALGAASSDESHPAKPELSELLRQIRHFLNPSERAMLEQILNLKNTIQMIQEMKAMMEMFQGKQVSFENSSGNTSENTGGMPFDPSMLASLMGMGSASGDPAGHSGSFGNMDFMNLFQGMPDPQQQAMFDMLKNAGFAFGETAAGTETKRTEQEDMTNGRTYQTGMDAGAGNPYDSAGKT